MFLTKLLSAVLILLVTLISGIYPFFKKLRREKLNFAAGEALASGVFLGAGLMHMLAPAADRLQLLGYHFPWAFLIAGSVFLLLLLMEHIGREFYTSDKNNNSGFAIIAVIMLSLHSFLAGAAVGVTQSLSVLAVILFAILGHKWAASFALSVQINKSNLSTKIGMILFLFFALMTPLGILLGSLVQADLNQFRLIEPVIMASAAGTFLYLGTLHGLKRAVLVEQCCGLKHFTWVIIGFLIMAVLA